MMKYLLLCNICPGQEQKPFCVYVLPLDWTAPWKVDGREQACSGGWRYLPEGNKQQFYLQYLSDSSPYAPKYQGKCQA